MTYAYLRVSTNKQDGQNQRIGAVRLTAAEKTELERRAAAERLTVSRYIHKILFG